MEGKTAAAPAATEAPRDRHPLKDRMMNIALNAADFQWIIPEIVLVLFGLARAPRRKPSGEERARQHRMRGAHSRRRGIAPSISRCASGARRPTFSTPLRGRQFRHFFKLIFLADPVSGRPHLPGLYAARGDRLRGVLRAFALRGPRHDGHGLVEQLHHDLHRSGGDVAFDLHPLRAPEGEPEGDRVVAQVFPPRLLRHGLLPLRHSA